MMCDDIDIEEHDVMQNAKEFYPDISIVKTETLYEDDDEEDISYHHGPIVESGLVEVHNADSTTEIQECTSHSGQFFGNKIILGFKKKTPDDEMQHELRCFQTRLRLKDCMVLLSNSRRYCFKCQILFPTTNLMYTHEMTTHSHLVEIDESSVSTEMSKPEYFCCKLCPSKFTRQFNLSKHYKFKHSNAPKESKDVCFVCHKPQASKEALIKHLYEKHYNNKMYSCQICSEQFKNKSDLEEHLYEHAKSKFDKKKPPTVSEDDTFKCHLCHLSFASKKSLCCHVNSYHNKKATNARKIRESDCMYKCTVCMNIFSNLGNARKHFTKIHGEIPLINSIRKVLYRKLSPSASTDHSGAVEKSLQHAPPTMIIGKSLQENREASPSASTDQMEVAGKPAQQLIPKNVIFKCDTCPLCFMNNKDALDHKHHKVPHDTCDKCHLCFPNSLMRLHELQHGCASKFQVISAFPNLRKRLLCKCPQCDVYFMETSLFLHLYYCKGDTKSFFCGVCQLDLNVKFKDSHLNDHAQFNKASDFIFVEYINVSSDAANDGLDVVPNEQNALLERYNSLSTIWNVLYKCTVCCFVVDNYTMVVEHCHEHFVRGGNLEKAVERCHTCGIDFEKVTHGRHTKLHKSNIQVNGASFNVLDYNYTEFYMKTWRKNLFVDLPEHDVERLIRDSPYKNVRTIKLRVIATGTSPYTLYKCEQCRCVVQEQYVVKHALKKHDAPFRRALVSCTNKCDVCHLQFSGHINWKKHQETHRKYKIGLNFFTVTSFNNIGDFQYNKMLKSPKLEDAPNVFVMHKCKRCGYVTESKSNASHHSSETDCLSMTKEYTRCSHCQLTFHEKEFFNHTMKHRQPEYHKDNFKITLFGSNKRNQPDSTRSKYIVYQCSKCKRCTRNKSKLTLHSCRSITRTCSKCGLIFSKNIMPSHLTDHERLPRYNIDNIRLVSFNANSTHEIHKPAKAKATQAHAFKVTKTKYVLYQCKVCAMNMVSIGSAMRHCRLYCNVNTANKYKCPKCALSFYHGLKGAHARMHLTHPNFTRQNIIINYFDKDTLYSIAKKDNPLKCKVVAKHARTVNEPLFDVDSDSTLSVKTPTRGINKPYMFFNCQNCLVYFTTKSSAARHTAHCKNKVTNTVCPVCEYSIYPRRLANHLKAHKKYPDMTRDNIETVTFTDRASLRAAPTSKTRVSRTPPVLREPADNEEYKFKLYQCKHCNMCSHMRSFVNRHFVSNCNRRPRTKCQLCGMLFASRALRRNKAHMVLHRKPEYTLDSILIVPFANGLVFYNDAYPAKFGKKIFNKNNKADADSDVTEEVTEFDGYSKTLYKCEVCLVHFPSKREAVKHAGIKHSQCVVKSKSDCEICGFAFPRTVLAKHNQYHHGSNQFCRNDFEVIPLQSTNIKLDVSNDDRADDTTTITLDEEFDANDWKTLYKCRVCDVLFVKSTTLVRHCCERHTKCIIINVRRCPICDLPFSSRTMKRHMEIHHDRLNFSRDDFTIVEGTPMSTKGVNEREFLASLTVVSRDPLDIVEHAALDETTNFVVR